MNIWMIGILGMLQLYGSDGQAGAVARMDAVVYKEADGQTAVLDVFSPEGHTDVLPAVVLIHGGAWNLNSRSDYYDFARGLARSGFVAVTPEIRATPPDGIYGQEADVKDAIRWIRSHAGELGVNPDRIGIYGSSSGGHLAALAGTTKRDTEYWPDPAGTSSEVQAAYYLFGIYDFPQSTVIAISNVIAPGMPFGIPTAELDRFSPLAYVSGNEPPTFMLHGTRDFMVPPAEARRFRDALRDNGVDVTLQFVEGQGHGFIKTAPWLRPWIYWSVRTFFIRELQNAA